MAQQLAALKAGENASVPDVKVDMFSTRGFALAQRIAGAFASSDAVPAAFRSHVLKKVGNQEQWVENTAAMGNCIVAIEVAQAVGMSVTAVMQNADVIEGKLRWSDRFVVAGINASRRFTPLRFDVKNLGPIKAGYKEKTGWDSQAKRPIFTDRTVELENLRSIAWALPAGFALPANIYTLDQAREAGMPVIEGPPVSMKLAVEEGWYAKPGSKWQTELKHKMLMMRSGRFFGDIHAPDIVMGIGRTSEDEQEVVTLDVQPDGSYAPQPPTDIHNLRNSGSPSMKEAAPSPAGRQGAAVPHDTETGEILDAGQQAEQQQDPGAPSFADAHAAVRDGDMDLARDIARSLPANQRQQIENAIANLQGTTEQQTTSAPAGRRQRGQGGLGLD